ncbi:MAG TPA: TolC family protein [Burkholderiaceae bacterium]|nr:TolC family protein [Burkholderiaceae bacterium]
MLGIRGTALLAGCTTVNLDQTIEHTQAQTNALTGTQLKLLRTAEDKAARDTLVSTLLAAPLGQTSAIQIAVLNSPALQSLLAERWADLSQAVQSGRLPNPILRLERVRLLDETELGRVLAFGLLDLLTLPQRNQMANARKAQAQLQMTSDVTGLVTQVRMAWIHAIAAQETAIYATQVYESAQASAELAKRMQRVGNFTRLQRARQQAFYADAAAQLLSSQQSATASREALVRVLGLDDTQASALKLPQRLPDIPKTFITPQELNQKLATQRLDVRMAQAQLATASRAQGLTVLSSLTDAELGLVRNTARDTHEGTSTTSRGFELDIRLPLFDWGDAQRANMNATTLAASNRLEAVLRAASSELRENYTAYRTAYDLSRHYRDEVVQLRKIISEENVLLYNGMFIGVFELLADQRDQVKSVMAAIAAQQQFWLADAALQSTVLGKPMSAPAISTPSTASSEVAAH